jgi:hypothetical protein
MAPRKLAWGALALLLIPAFVLPSETPDWPAWIVGARLAGDASRLYSFQESQKITSAFAEPRNGVWAFVRPPIYATLLTPLGWVNPRQAFIVWQIVNLAALAVAAWLFWPSFWTPLIAVCCPPILASFKQGQDMPLFLLALAVAAKLMHKRPVLAGMVLALLGLKVHLLLLIPVFFVMKRAWRMAAGFLAGGALLLAGCFALYGRIWPSLYFGIILENQKHLGDAGWFGNFSVARAVLLVVSAGVSVVLMRKIEDRELALFTALAISLIPAPHLYPYDFALAFPLLLCLVRKYALPTASAASA